MTVSQLRHLHEHAEECLRLLDTAAEGRNLVFEDVDAVGAAGRHVDHIGGPLGLLAITQPSRPLRLASGTEFRALGRDRCAGRPWAKLAPTPVVFALPICPVMKERWNSTGAGRPVVPFQCQLHDEVGILLRLSAEERWKFHCDPRCGSGAAVRRPHAVGQVVGCGVGVGTVGEGQSLLLRLLDHLVGMAESAEPRCRSRGRQGSR